MQALALTTDRDYYTRAANEDCINGGPRTRTKYTYDALNRVVGYSINGAAQAIGFDALGRTTSTSNPLDAFTYGYADATARVSGISSTQGPASALTYFGPTGDELLQQIAVTTHGGTSLSTFGYTNNADDNVTSFSTSSPTAQTLNYAYDKANRLLSSTLSGATQNAYGYDSASNLSSITANGSTQTFSYTSTNSLTSGNYDANGSPVGFGTNTYTWDGANRIVSFAGAANKASTFTYDGLGRLVRIVDTTSGTITADHSYTWCGSARCLAHDNAQSGSPVSTQYFDQGAIIGGTPNYYVKDRLGSVTELVTSAGSVAVQYTYDPYGNPTTVSGTVASDIGYGGYVYHAVSGLDFAMYRAYDPSHAHWLNRDPIGESGGVNLYAYADGNPISESDPLGLFGVDDIYGFIYDTTGGYTPSQGLIDYTTGFGDAASLNITSLIRDANGTNDLVDKCSTAYRAGGYTTAALGAGRLAYAGLAKGFSIFAASGAEASAARSALRRYFGGGQSLRPPNLTKYLTDDALRAAAGRTNPLANLYGAGIAATGAAKGSGCGCSN
jgi:RHS repeat-associated protein